MSEERGNYDARGLIDNTRYILHAAARDILKRRDPKFIANIEVGMLYKLTGALAEKNRGFLVTGIGTHPLSLLPAVHGVLLTVVDGEVEESPMVLDPSQIGSTWGL